MQLTDHIVAVLITHEADQGAVAALVDTRQRANHLPTLGLLAVFNALLDHIAGELVLGVSQELRHHHCDHARPVFIFTILDDMLDDIVAKLIRDQL